MNEKIITISSTSFTPEIIINYDKKRVSLIGKSIPQDAYGFYLAVTNKLSNIPELTLEVDFEYINSASLRFLTLAISTELELKKVIWYYEKDDVDIEEKGKLIKEITLKEQPEVIFEVVEKV